MLSPSLPLMLVESPDSLHERLKWRGNPPYMNEYPVFQKPPAETPIIFENLHDWDWFKAKYNNRYKYGIDMHDVTREPTPPPPYEP